MSFKNVIQVPNVPKPRGVWSNTIVTSPGQMVFISGMLARAADGALMGVGDIEIQTRQTCENLKSAIEAAGGTLANIVRVDVYITDMRHFDAIHAVRRIYFPVDPPVSTMVQVIGFTLPGAMIEMNAIAVLPQGIT